jgi:hypothetical protein
LIEFLKLKTTTSTTPSAAQTSLSICPQMTINIPPEQPKLTVVKENQIDIKPKKIYHPTILNACKTMFDKHPDHLSQEEIQKFNHYRSWKSEIGDPIEANPIYLPIGGLRKCLICSNLT